MASTPEPKAEMGSPEGSHAEAVYHDAHVHLFNGSDLPIVGFTRYVALPKMLPGWAELAAAFTDILLHVVKPLAPTIERERHRLGLGLIGDDATELSAGAAAQRIAEHINTRLEKIDADRGKINLADFQLVLSEDDASLLLLARILASPQLLGEGRDRPTRTKAADYKVAPATIQLLLEGKLVDWSDTSSIAAEAFIGAAEVRSLSKRSFQQTWVWVWRMFHGRIRHLKTYAKEMHDADFIPARIINLLVDFDEWLRLPWNNDLADGPSRKSSHQHQIEFWRDVPKKHLHDIDVWTFAGYDPLKHAKELSRGATPENETAGRSEYFDQLAAYVSQGAIKGFKLYPPMGFRAYDNKHLCAPCNGDFVGETGIGTSIVDWWGERPRLGAALDRALDAIYALAIKNDIPILMHTGATNLTATNFAERTSLKHLVAATDTNAYPNLRVCIAHFADANNFIAEMDRIVKTGCSLKYSTLDAIRYGSCLFTSRTPNVYADTGHMEEFLHGSDDLPERFFRALFDFFDRAPGAADRIMFGSDWIMLARQSGFKEYVKLIRRGLNAAIGTGSSSRYKDFPEKFFRTNFNAYLDLA